MDRLPVDFEDAEFGYRAGGVTQRRLAREFGVSQPQIGHIVRGEHWAHLSLQKES